MCTCNHVFTIIIIGLQFLDIIGLSGTVQLSESEVDFFSDPIYVRDGIPVGVSLETAVHVRTTIV